MPRFSFRRSSTPTSSSTKLLSRCSDNDSDQQQGCIRRCRSSDNDSDEQRGCIRRNRSSNDDSDEQEGCIRRSGNFLVKLFGGGSSKTSSACRSTSGCLSKRASRTSQSKPSPPSGPFRRGWTFCGLCDMRIATVLLNIVHISVEIVLELLEIIKWGNRNYSPVLLLLVLGFSGLGMVGALRFSPRAIFVSSIGLCFLWWTYFIEVYVFGLVLLFLVLFAQVVFAIEVKAGIMTAETYATEGYMDRDGKKALQKVQRLSVDLGETAKEFSEEVAIVYGKKQKKKKQTKKVAGNQQAVAPGGDEEEPQPQYQPEIEPVNEA